MFKLAKEQLSKYEKLILMCERLTFNNRSDFISNDWEVFKVLYYQFLDKFNKEIKPKIDECKIL